jgi:hypothetical protein
MRTCDVLTEFRLEFISLSLLILSVLNLKVDLGCYFWSILISMVSLQLICSSPLFIILKFCWFPILPSLSLI